MRRREFITLFGGAAASWPLAVWAQQPDRVRRIGVLMSALESNSEYHVYVSDFRKELQKLGWAEGRNLRIDYRWGALNAESRQAIVLRGRADIGVDCLNDTPNRAWSKGMNASSTWPRNRLLLALPSRDLKRLMPELEQIRCQRAQVLMNADSSLDHVFFPDSGVVSVVAVYASGSIIEMATIGREGCSGVQAILGAKRSSVQLLVQIPGSAAKMSRAAFTRAMESMPSFRSVMDAYVQAFLEQVMVSVACNGAHSLKQRLARWLLMMRDRSDGDALLITQSLLAEMLGVHRPSITNAFRELERSGLIESRPTASHDT